MIFVFLFIFGSIVGSFLNVVLFRKNTGESIIFAENGRFGARSRCFSCGKELGFLEMVPILSFLLQKGRCVHCGSKISWQYPIVEALTGVLALSLVIRLLGWAGFFWYFVAFSILFLVAAYDFRTKIIDSHFLYIFGAFSLIEFLRRGNFENDLAFSFFIALFFYLLWFFSKGTWMGRGDANLAFFASLFLGFPLNLAMLFISFWAGGIFGIILILTRGFNLKSEIPFGPFIALAVFLAWFFGAPLGEFLKEFKL